jgi:hypothetical protein
VGNQDVSEPILLNEEREIGEGRTVLSHSWSITGRFFSRGIWIDHFPPSLLASSSQAGMMLSCNTVRHVVTAGEGKGGLGIGESRATSVEGGDDGP